MRMSKVSLRRRAVNKARDIGHHAAFRLGGTRFAEREWRNRANDPFYWESRDHPHRDLLMRALADRAPGSVLEIGCNTGPNLYRLARLFPTARLLGIDVSREAIAEGRRLFSEAGIENVELRLGTADDLAGIADRSMDVVFTDAVLIYVGRDKIDRVMAEMRRVAKKALILMEWHDPNAEAQGTYIYEKGYWKRDYVSLLKSYFQGQDVKVTKISREVWDDDYWSEFGAMIEVSLSDDGA